MLKFIKGNLENIDGVADLPHYLPAHLLYIFCNASFGGYLQLKKSTYKQVSNIPLENDNKRPSIMKTIASYLRVYRVYAYSYFLLEFTVNH